MTGTLVIAPHKVIHPIILEAIRVGVEPIRLRDDLDLPVVVGGAAVRGNHRPLEVRVLEVGSAVVANGLIGLSLL